MTGIGAGGTERGWCVLGVVVSLYRGGAGGVSYWTVLAVERRLILALMAVTMTYVFRRTFGMFMFVAAFATLAGSGCDSRSVRSAPPNVGRPDGGRLDGPQGGADLRPIDTTPACLAEGAPRKAPGDDCVCDGDCTTNTCSGGVCCSGAACGAKRPPGATCADPTQCDSGYCADGVCCNVACSGSCVSCNQPERMGECAPVPAGADDPHDMCREDSPDTCGQSGACNGQGGCARYPQGTICKLSACEGRERFVPASVCDGEGVCVIGKSISCQPSTCEDGACITSCTVDTQCMSPAVCRDANCGKRGPGQTCTAADQCQSGFCVEGVCCTTACGASCNSCALPGSLGTCTPVPANAADPKMICKDAGRAACAADGKCDGNGGCQKYKDGTTCQDPKCDPGANVETPAGTCQRGACQVPAVRTCAPHKGCTGSRCLTSCGGDSQCTTGNFCIMGTCGKRPDGALCSGDSQCTSGTCAQGRCCATGCTGSCKSCAVPGREGVCSDVPSGGADPAGVCRDDACSNGCNGAGGCRREQAGTTCGAATCSGNTRNTRVCNADGACGTASEPCSGATPECMGGSCVPPAKTANGGTCLAGAECQSGQCVRNRCCATACGGDCKECLAPSWTCTNRGGTCGEGGACSAGICCPPGQVACGGTCRNLQSDASNCGACGTKCPAATPTCLAGRCDLICQPGQTKCGTTCSDVGSDVNNCGACGTRCGAGAWTCGGAPPKCACANAVCGTTCCVAGKICGGAGGTSCVDPVCTGSTTRCKPGGGTADRQQCAGGNWQDIASCAAPAPICTGAGTCVQCTGAGFRCPGGNRRDQCVAGVWTAMNCDAGWTCTGAGTCTPECTGMAFRCKPDGLSGTRQQCQGGRWTDVAGCMDDKPICTGAGTCVACQGTGFRCSGGGNGRQQCANNNWVAANCPAGWTCTGTGTATMCTPQCNGTGFRCKPDGAPGQRQQCTGGIWADVASCPGATPICNTGNGGCVACTGDGFRCKPGGSAGERERCMNNSWVASNCPAGNTCSGAGACQPPPAECTTGDVRCRPGGTTGERQVCTAGTWTTANCTGADPLCRSTDGKCVACLGDVSRCKPGDDPAARQSCDGGEWKDADACMAPATCTGAGACTAPVMPPG